MGDSDQTKCDKQTSTEAPGGGGGGGGRRAWLGALLCAAAAALGALLQSGAGWGGGRAGRTYWVYSASSDVQGPRGPLRHVHAVLGRLGYDRGAADSWDLLWSHDYPFRALRPQLQRLRPHQKVNHFPGTGFITNKVDFATTDSEYIPRAFKLPAQRAAFLEYARAHPDAWFLEKHNQHRGVRLRSAGAVDAGGSAFAQECVRAPLLVGGHKFDIGVYVALTAVRPLRAYWYAGDVLFRYCPEEYYPFDPENLDKYVVADDYRPTWAVPALRRYAPLGLGMKDTFDVYMRDQGIDPDKIWSEVQTAIAEILLKKEHHIVEALKGYPGATQGNFFELMRFDLVLDSERRVHLLEANMSPNLSSAHFPPNQLLYEQLLYSLLTLAGVGAPVARDRDSPETKDMLAADKNIAVFAAACSACVGCGDGGGGGGSSGGSGGGGGGGGGGAECALCRPCLTDGQRASFKEAHREFMHRGDFRRLFPPPMKQGPVDEERTRGLSESNRLQYMWFQGKCNADAAWCT